MEFQKSLSHEKYIRIKTCVDGEAVFLAKEKGLAKPG
jgi:hypothetical protein